MKVRMEGFDELRRKLKQIQKSAQELHGEKQVNLTELLTDKFLSKYTTYRSFEEFENEEIFKQYESFDDIPEEKLNQLIVEKTTFSSWMQMLEKASAEYVAGKLGL